MKERKDFDHERNLFVEAWFLEVVILTIWLLAIWQRA